MPKGFAEQAQPGLSPAVGTHPGGESPTVEHMRLTLGPGGRVVIPADVRRRMGVKEGDTLIGAFDGTELKVFSLMELIRRAQETVKGAYPPGYSVVDEFLRERRALWGEDEPDRSDDD